MFTIDQIKAAHSKVKSGADFPRYIQDLIALGVTGYETYVSDGHTAYYGANAYNAVSEPKYDLQSVAVSSDKVQFQKELKDHQQGLTDYPAFCAACARLGVEKWVVDIAAMTCSYYDKAASEMLVERIPQ